MNRNTRIETLDVFCNLRGTRDYVGRLAERNRDDHSKNFSFLLNKEDRWKFAPAYDLTPSVGFNGEHAAMVNGKGKYITSADLIQAASIVGVSGILVTEAVQRTEHV